MRSVNSREMGRACSTLKRRDMHTLFWYDNVKEGDHQENIDVDVKIILKCALKNKMGGCELDSSVSG
jgi:hypothetical protein